MARHGLNFRDTLGHATDGADEVGVIAGSGTRDQYPTTRGGLTFGWGGNPTTSADVTSSDARFAGYHAQTTTGEQTFRFDVPEGAGTYDLWLALGAHNTTTYDARFRVYDGIDDGAAIGVNDVLLFTINVASGGARTITDANGTDISSSGGDITAFLAGWSARSITLTGSALKITLGRGDGSGVGYSRIMHLAVEQPDGPTLALAADTRTLAVTITNDGGGDLTGLAVGTITYTTGSGWASAVVDSNDGSRASVVVTVDPSGLAAGVYECAVPVTLSGATNTPQSIPVRFIQR